MYKEKKYQKRKKYYFLVFFAFRLFVLCLLYLCSFSGSNDFSEAAASVDSVFVCNDEEDEDE